MQPRRRLIWACLALVVVVALALSANLRVHACLAMAPLVGLFGDEFEADFGERAGVIAGPQMHCSVIRATERTASAVVLNGYLTGLVENAAPWVRTELVAMWQRRPEEWAKLQIARALQELDVIPGGLWRFPEVSRSDPHAVLAARRAIERVAEEMQQRGETTSCA